MMRFRFAIVLYFAISFYGWANNTDYKNANLPIDKKVDLLISKMTLAEKIAQLQNRQWPSVIKFYNFTTGELNTDSLKKYFPHGFGGINIEFTLSPEMYVKAANDIQKFNMQIGQGIPAMFIGEGLHGLMSKGATVFPQAIALGSTWDTVLLEKLYNATAIEARARGVRQILGPVLDLGRDARFGRIEEMYSEDPCLVSQYGKAAVYGFQGHAGKPDTNHVASTLKHFVGHGQPEGGRNTAPINVSTYDLFNDHIFPFETCIQEAKVLSVMPSYNEMNGIPNHANHWLLQDVLRKQLKFNGLVCADQNAVDETHKSQNFVATDEEAVKLAINNGIDIDIVYFHSSYELLEKLIANKELSESVVDSALHRFLKLKFMLGLFDNPYSSVKRMQQVTNCKEHKAIALEAAQKSIVLLKNENNLLPLDSAKIKTIAVIGPNAKGVHFGGYSIEPRNGIDILDGIKNFSKNRFNVLYAEGCKIAKEEGSFWNNGNQTPNEEASDRKLIDEAVATASKSDVIVLAIGENESFAREGWAEYHKGDRESLDLLGLQNDLVKELLKTGKPIVTILINGRPLSFNYVAKNVPAIIEGWYLGQETGTAIADVLFGKINPSGKLAVTIPKSVGELPCYYDRKPSRNRSYINVENKPLYPFGFGLSYTNYEYSGLKLNKNLIKAGESLQASITIKNTGKKDGEEIVQLYIHDLISSGVRPILELKDFARVKLNSGESKNITFTITPDKLSFYNYELKKVLEPGEFTIYIGPDSEHLQNINFKVE